MQGTNWSWVPFAFLIVVPSYWTDWALRYRGSRWSHGLLFKGPAAQVSSCITAQIGSVLRGLLTVAEFALNSATFGLPAVVAARGGITDRVAFWQSWSRCNLPSWVIPHYWTADQVQRSLDALGNVP